MVVSSAARALFTYRLLSGRDVPSWVQRSLVRAALASASSTGETAPATGAAPGSNLLASLADRFHDQVAHASAEVPFYRGRRPLGATLDRQVIPGFDEVPVTTRDDLAGAGGAMVARSGRPTLAFSSTGTTGRPVTVWFSASELELLSSLSALSNLASGAVRPDDVVAICTAPGVAQTVALRSAGLVGATAMVLDGLSVGELVARLVTPVALPGHAPKPTVMVAPASLLAEIVAFIEQTDVGPDDLGLRLVVFGGEVVVAPRLVERAVAAFGDGLEVTESYGITEVFPVSGSVCEDDHLHFDPATGLVEVKALGEDRRAEPGELGTLVVTPFAPFRSATPLLRYDTGDLVVRLGDAGSPPCSRAGTPATSRVLGKAKHLVEVGSRLLTPRRLAEMLERVPSMPTPARYAICGDPTPGLAIVVEPGVGDATLLEVEELFSREGFGPIRAEAVAGLEELARWNHAHGGALIPLRVDRLRGLDRS